MIDVLARAVDELDVLDERIDKLSDFVQHGFPAVSDDYERITKDQLQYMHGYRRRLAYRIVILAREISWNFDD